MSLIEPHLRESAIAAVRELGDTKVTDMYVECFDNTLDTTVEQLTDGSTFIITGDIPAMWLRDSVAQVRSYLVFANRSESLRRMITGLIAKQADCILHDPYANAFNRRADGAGHRDLTEQSDLVWERKYEVDSLSYPIQLAYMFWQITGETSWATPQFAEAARAIVHTIATEQNHEVLSPYRFERPDAPVPSDTLIREGKGSYTAITGMTWSAFRPSDDACKFGYNVPGNAFAAVAMGYLADIAQTLLGDAELSYRATTLAEQLRMGIAGHGIVRHAVHGNIYAYEVDGTGGVKLMDDANVPSLLALPMLGWCTPDDPVYLATRRFVLSAENPYFYSGPCAAGMGSPHTPPDYVWPIALCVQGITSLDRGERSWLLTTLRDIDADTLLMHESVNVHNPADYTRKWFSWANSMFCEFVLDMAGMPVPSM